MSKNLHLLTLTKKDITMYTGTALNNGIKKFRFSNMFKICGRIRIRMSIGIIIVIIGSGIQIRIGIKTKEGGGEGRGRGRGGGRGRRRGPQKTNYTVAALSSQESLL
jgi:hypothetical protein